MSGDYAGGAVRLNRVTAAKGGRNDLSDSYSFGKNMEVWDFNPETS